MPARAQRPSPDPSHEPHPTVSGHRCQGLSPLLGPLTPEMLSHLEGEMTWRTVADGETLCRQGDPAEALYVVISGRLRAVATTPDGGERCLGVFGPGEIIGEAALLGDRHPASVQAVRDGDLARISPEGIERLAVRFPHLGLRLSKLLAGRRSGEDAGTGPKTIAVVPSGPGVPLASFVRRLERALAAHGQVTRLDARAAEEALQSPGISQASPGHPDHLRLVHWLDAREGDGVVLYQADAEVSPWADRCVRQADHVLIVADADADPKPGEVEERLAQSGVGRSLVLLQRGQPRGTARWLDLRDVGRHYHLRLESSADLERLARCLTGRAVGWVLGGGGARGAAHIGVLRALDEAGTPVDMVGGTSMGAILAGLCALGNDSREVLRLCRRAFGSLIDYTFPTVSLLRGQRIEAACAEVFGDLDVEDLWIPFFAVSTHLGRAEQVVHRRGRVVDVLLASSALPGVLPPVEIDGEVLVDGGLLNNVPADVLRGLMGSGTVIATDVSQSLDFESEAKNRRRPGILRLLRRTRQLGAAAARRRMKRVADVYLELPLQGVKLLDFHQLEAIAARGYELAVAAFGPRCRHASAEPASARRQPSGVRRFAPNRPQDPPRFGMAQGDVAALAAAG